MEIEKFIENYREAFGEAAGLPVVFWYSDEETGHTEKIGGCFFKGMQEVRAGNTISLNAEVIGCGGGKFYTGFAPMPEHVPGFVSLKEKYKKTPGMVKEFVDELGIPRAEKKYLHFARIDRVEHFDGLEGILFLATPDILSGLTTWAYFDNNSPDTVMAMFGSGCCSVVTQAVLENRMGGKRTFLGFFDPSVRPWFEADILSFTIPMSRFRVMYDTMRESCLFGTPARSNRNHVLLQEEPVWHLLFSEIHRLRATGPIASKIFYPYRSVYHAKTVGNIESPRQKFYRNFWTCPSRQSQAISPMQP